MTYDIEVKIEELKIRQHRGMDTYADWKSLAELILAHIDIAEGRYGRRSCEDYGAGWGS
jgi:hypothetical protein